MANQERVLYILCEIGNPATYCENMLVDSTLCPIN